MENILKQLDSSMNVKIESTVDYGKFNRLKGNRRISNKRVAIIKNSIESIGYISNPIIVNEKLEVIDGQGRLEALKELGMPVEYRIIPSIGIRECRAMNLKPTSWTVVDFVKSYAEYGNENYVRLLELNEKYGISCTTLHTICSYLTKSGRASQEELRNGIFVMSEERKEEVSKICERLKELESAQKEIGGSKELFHSCVAWCMMRDGVNIDRLIVSIQQQSNEIHPFAKTKESLAELSKVYNKGYSKANRRFFDYEWQIK